MDWVEIRARVGGILGGQRFSECQDVAEGAVLFAIDPAPYEAVVEQRKAAIEAAEATVEVATAQHERALWRTRSILGSKPNQFLGATWWAVIQAAG